MSPATFGKRIYTLPRFVADLRDVMRHMDDLRAAVGRGRVGGAFAEKIMLAVTQVNDCRWCNFGHTRAALKAGVSQEELQHLLASEFDALPADEVTALVFAQHYAEQEGHPDEEAWQRLLDTYGPETARDIMAYIRMITLGNLLGNTFDAFLSRLAGRSAPNSSPLSELGVLALAVIAGPLGLLATLFSRLTRVFRAAEQRYLRLE